MDDEAALQRLFRVLDTLGGIAQAMHSRRLDALVAMLDDKAIEATSEQVALAATLAGQACTGLRGTPHAENPMRQAYRAMRRYHRAVEALAALAETIPSVGRYFLEPRFRDDPFLLERLRHPHPDAGLYHCGNQTTERGGFSVYVPPTYDPANPGPLVMALHGGSGHGRLFLWNWFPEARSRNLIIVAPTAIGGTWSLMEPELDSENLQAILVRVRERWAIDPARLMLTGMSDGGTFTLLSGLAEDSPFTHLAPVAASFHPLLLTITTPARLTGLPIHLTHGAQDWMFPVDMARTAYRTLASAGADIAYRELPELSHAYPRDGQGEVLDWWLGGGVPIGSFKPSQPPPPHPPRTHLPA